MEKALSLCSAWRKGAHFAGWRLFCPLAGNNWFSQGLVKPGIHRRSLKIPGKPGAGHQWAYLPDVAETVAASLARRDELEPFSCFICVDTGILMGQR
jgi:hypothetical protein